MSALKALRLSHSHTMHLPADPATVFPLLCPVREQEWLAGWKARIVYSESGLAEPGCVFTTPGENGSGWVWVVSRHEPSEAVQMVVHAPGSHVLVLDIRLEPEEGGTRTVWTYTLTALEGGHETFHRQYIQAKPKRMEDLEARLRHFLLTGACLA